MQVIFFQKLVIQKGGPHVQKEIERITLALSTILPFAGIKKFKFGLRNYNFITSATKQLNFLLRIKALTK